MHFGKQFRIVKESIHKQFDGKSTDFEPACILRCTDLIEQMLPLEKQLRHHLKTLDTYGACSRDFIASTRSVLTAPMPETTTPNGTVVDSDPMISVDETRLSTNIAPIERWLAEFTTVKDDRMSALKKVQLELDSRRRQECDLTSEFAKLHFQATQLDGAKLEKHNKAVDEAKQRLDHKQYKQQGVATQFEDLEAAVYQQLATLATDAAQVPSYLCGMLAVFKDMFSTAEAFFPEDIQRACQVSGPPYVVMNPIMMNPGYPVDTPYYIVPVLGAPGPVIPPPPPGILASHAPAAHQAPTKHEF